MRDGAPRESAIVRFGVLGSLEVTCGGEPILLGSPKQRAVLGILLINSNRVVSTDRLINEIWGDGAALERQNALWVHISNLRKALEPENATRSSDGPLRTRSPGYVLDVDSNEVDSVVFERLLAEGRALTGTDAAAASIVFAESLALWRGPAYADFAYEPWAQAEISRLEELRLEAVESRIDADLRRGMTRELVGELESLVHQHPTREQLAGALMLTLHRSGRTADALRQYQLLRGRLGDELGVEPSTALQRLNERIVTSDPSLDSDHRAARSDGGVAPGLSVRGYEIRERLAVRGSGVLYRAFQAAVGREVVIKVIRPELADDPTFIRRFEDEAQLVARLEHPHIVPLYDYWREPGAAYLVMRYMRGGTLADVIARGAMGTDRLAKMVDQIGAALESAHRSGVIHGRVCPDNILVDDSGNAYLADFEITSAARIHSTIRSPIAAVAGSPELRCGDDLAPASDVYGFAVTVAQAATGRTDAISDLLVGLDGQLAAVLQRATEEEIADRFEDAGTFRRAVATAFRVGGDDATPEIDANPYKGLRSFAQSDSRDFFGRQRFVDRLVARMSRAGSAGRFVAVVGPSGSGKSSVVRAGLIPALRHGAAPGSDGWFTVETVPASHPFEQLERALLTVAVKPPTSLLEQLSGSRGIHRAVERVLPEEDSTLVLVIDQFEELFTQTAPDEAVRFIDALVDAVHADRSRVRIVITLRADFYDRPLAHRGLSELLRHGTELLTPMSPEELERAVSGPAERVGATCEPALIGELVAAVVDRPAALPLLQYTLTELFERRSGHTLTIAAYHELGGVSGALVDRAEAIYVGLEPDERRAAPQIFLRLVTLGDGSSDTRRRVPLSELTTIVDVGPHARRVTDTFARHRLLGFDRDPVTRGPTVEIAHEALLSAWPRLRRWIADARSDVGAERRLADAANEWIQNHRDPAFVLTGGRLARYEGWAESPPIGITSAEREFLDASELAEAEQRLARANEERREAQLRRRSRMLVGMAVTVVLVLALGAYAVVQQRRASGLATEISRSAASRDIAARAQLLTSSDPELANMLAIEAARVASAQGELPPEVMDALHAAVHATGTQYPVEDAPSALRAGAGGGVYLLPPDELVRLAQGRVTREFTDDECRSADLDTCPDPREPVAPGLGIAGGDEAYAGAGNMRPLAGATVELVTPVTGTTKEAIKANFESFTERTGIRVIVSTQRVDQETFLLALDEADILNVPQPGAIPTIAPGKAMDVTRYLDREELEATQSPYLTSLLSRGDDGSWPSASGPVYGVWDKLDAKSLIWYNIAAFEQLGRDLPETWEQLVQVSDQLVADGDHPWCIFLGSGPASGWPVTDVIESALLRAEGPEFYDAWSFHDIAFDHPAVLASVRRVGELVFTPDYLDRSPATAAQTPFQEGPLALVTDPPGCTFLPLGSFTPSNNGSPAGQVTDAFDFPVLDPAHSDTMVGGGTYVVALADRPEVREVMKYIASPAYGQASVEAAVGHIPANIRFDLDRILNPTERRIAEMTHAALRGDGFRFDASDLMPVEVGAGTFWAGMIDWFVEGPDALDGIMAGIEADWPDDEPEE
jgi:DNA-binding SARP family transcriptional activator/serine/threonine protein kinase/ABC-type glycerol-3-phosphate transport system substrate-binding protein